MADSMVERVARVLCKQAGRDPDAHLPQLPQMLVQAFDQGRQRPAWVEFTSPAREIITAMREPTVAMAQASSGYGNDDWPAMIDAALAE